MVPLRLVLGRTDQLLPVVCNPGAIISPNSKLKVLGKTPSLYNRNRLATGINDWTGHVVTEHDFARWSNEPDYGICVRTGHGWLALDCDSEDEDIQADIRKTLVQLLVSRRRDAGEQTVISVCICWPLMVISVSVSIAWRGYGHYRVAGERAAVRCLRYAQQRRAY